MDENWYVLAVHARKENFVEQQLRSEGYKVACPRYLKSVRHARRISTVAAPLFPGYLFIRRSANSTSWRHANWIPGAIGLVKVDRRPVPLKSKFVDHFISNLDRNGVVQINQEISLGDKVQALGGPFDRVAGEVIELSDDSRIKILMHALNRKVEMTLPRSTVVVAA